MGKIERNLTWLAAANLTGSFFSVILFIYLARTLQAEYFGCLSYASTLVIYLFNFIDFGLSTYGIREIAKNRSQASEYVSNIISFKLMLAIILFTVIAVISLLVDQAAIIKILMLEMALMFFISALASEWAFQGIEKMHIVFGSIASISFLQLIFNLILVKGPDDILKVPLIYFFTSMPVIAFLLHRLKFKARFFTLDLKKIQTYLLSSIFIWAISIFAQVYNGLDIVILGHLRPPEDVGIFSVAKRIVGIVTLLMTFLTGAILPHLSCTFKDYDMRNFHNATRKFIKVSGIILLVVVLPILLFGEKIISVTVGSEYLPASIPLKIMLIALILVTFNLPYSTGLIAVCMEREVLKQVCASALLNVILNFLLIPRYGIIGASISFVMAELLALGWILWVYNRKIGLSVSNSLRQL